MNKSELVSAVADELGTTKAAAGAALDAIINQIVKAVAKGDSAVLVGFGTFEAQNKPQRTGRNPATGAELLIPAKRVPRFKVGSKFKAEVAA
jgi:DNA-binding protein HU-beta